MCERVVKVYLPVQCFCTGGVSVMLGVSDMKSLCCVTGLVSPHYQSLCANRSHIVNSQSSIRVIGLWINLPLEDVCRSAEVESGLRSLLEDGSDVLNSLIVLLWSKSRIKAFTLNDFLSLYYSSCRVSGEVLGGRLEQAQEGVPVRMTEMRTEECGRIRVGDQACGVKKEECGRGRVGDQACGLKTEKCGKRRVGDQVYGRREDKFVIILVDLHHFSVSPFLSVITLHDSCAATVTSCSHLASCCFSSDSNHISLSRRMENNNESVLSVLQNAVRVWGEFKISDGSNCRIDSENKQCLPLCKQRRVVKDEGQQQRDVADADSLSSNHHELHNDAQHYQYHGDHIVDLVRGGSGAEHKPFSICGTLITFLSFIVSSILRVSKSGVFGHKRIQSILFTPAITCELSKKFLSVSDRLSSQADVSERVNSQADVSDRLSSQADMSERVNSQADVSDRLSSQADMSERVNSQADVSDRLSSQADMSERVKSNCKLTVSNSRGLKRLKNILLIDTLCTQLLDSILGVLFVVFVLRAAVNSHIISTTDFIDYAQVVAGKCEELIHWLMGAPAGLKLNQPLARFLAHFFLCHVYLWTNYLEAVRTYWTGLMSIILLSPVVGLLGLTVQLAAAQDLLSIITLHIYCFYVYAARLYHVHVSAVSSLWRLFLGRKWNVLRRRVDTLEQHSVLQLYVGTLLLVVLVFLLPTTALYYSVFCLLRLVVLLLHSSLSLLISLLNSIPVYLLTLRITNSSLIQCDVELEQVSHDDVVRLLRGSAHRPHPHDGIRETEQLNTDVPISSSTLWLQLKTRPVSLSDLLRLSRTRTSELLSSLSSQKLFNPSLSHSSSRDGVRYSWSALIHKLLVGQLIYPWIEVNTT